MHNSTENKESSAIKINLKNTIIDNSCESLKMVNVLKECLHTYSLKTVMIATGYWDIPGLSLLAKELRNFLEQQGTSLKLLIGKDPYVYASQVKEPKYKDLSYPDDFIKVDLNNLDIKDEYCDAVKLLIDYCTEEENSKIQIRIFRKNEADETQFLHSKCYIFDGKEVGIGYGIIGSSNFTSKGLEGNSELNYLETDVLRVLSNDVIINNKSHVVWFNEKWELSEPWNKKFLEQILKRSPIYILTKPGNDGVQPNKPSDKIKLTPYEVYIKYLQSQIGDIADPRESAVIKSYLPKGYAPLSFQIDAVQQCFLIMKNYGGFILGDVVGLGKTVVGLLIIKKFLAEAESLQRARKVLIVVPPAIKPDWEKTLNDFDKDATDKIGNCIKFITTGSIGKLIEDDGIPEVEEEVDAFDGNLGYDDYGLIIIDESHNFRNNETQKYQDLDLLIGNILLRTGNAPFVGLLSATPQNNSPRDIRNQIYLFQREPNHSSLPNIKGGKLDAFFARMIKDFNEARKTTDSEEGKRKLQYVSTQIRERVLNDLVVRRTRTDIKKHYKDDSANLSFPTVMPPHKLEYKLDDELSTLFSDTIKAIVKDDDKPFNANINLGFYRYEAISYLISPDYKKLYEGRNISTERVSSQLSNIMRILLVKRLESSFKAFKTSLHNLQRNTQYMIDMLENDTVYICPDIDVNGEIEEAGSLSKAIPSLDAKVKRKGGNNRKFKTGDFKAEYIKLLQQDLELINYLCRRWDENDYDPKFDKFKEVLSTTLFDPQINNPHQYDKPRLVIFTEAIDTMKTLVRYLKANGHRPLEISAKNRDEKRQAIVENFDANSEVKKDDYDVIVTTEVLAEGVNLHRANVILNYDTPWNSTKLMQRIGRVNRIGSKEDYIHVFNFYPTSQSDAQIKLVEIAYAKLQAFHTMFGGDSKVFSDQEDLSEADFNRLVDDEESPFGKYIADLKTYQKEHPDRYAMISETPLKNLGGRISSDPNKVVAVVSAKNRGLTNILHSDNEDKIISPLDCMAELRCDKSAEFSADINYFSDAVTDSIIRCYQQHITVMANARDVSKTIRDAMTYLHKIKHEISSEEANRSWSAANVALRANNTTVANKLLKYKEEREKNGETLFGVDNDIDAWITSAFSIIAQKANVWYGEPVLAICEEK